MIAIDIKPFPEPVFRRCFMLADKDKLPAEMINEDVEWLYSMAGKIIWADGKCSLFSELPFKGYEAGKRFYYVYGSCRKFPIETIKIK